MTKYKIILIFIIISIIINLNYPEDTPIKENCNTTRFKINKISTNDCNLTLKKIKTTDINISKNNTYKHFIPITDLNTTKDINSEEELDSYIKKFNDTPSLESIYSKKGDGNVSYSIEDDAEFDDIYEIAYIDENGTSWYVDKEWNEEHLNKEHTELYDEKGTKVSSLPNYMEIEVDQSESYAMDDLLGTLDEVQPNSIEESF